MNLIRMIKYKFQKRLFRNKFKKAHPLERGQLRFKQRYPQYEYGFGSYGIPQVDHGHQNAVLKIGKFCSIAGGVTILLGGNHNTAFITTYPFYEKIEGMQAYDETKGDVIIGNDVWLGTDCLILSGVTIGDGAVVAARSVVTKNIPPYAIVGGNPAKLIRYRFSEEVREQLLANPWWSLPDANIITIAPLLCSESVDDLISHVQSVSS